MISVPHASTYMHTRFAGGCSGPSMMQMQFTANSLFTINAACMFTYQWSYKEVDSISNNWSDLISTDALLTPE